MKYLEIIHPEGKRSRRFDIVRTLFLLCDDEAGEKKMIFNDKLAEGDEENWYNKLYEEYCK